MANLDELAQLAIGTEPGRPLPLPKEVAGRLQAQAIRAVKDWVDRFAPGYPKLKVSYAVLQRVVDFQSLTLGSMSYNVSYYLNSTKIVSYIHILIVASLSS